MASSSCELWVGKGLIGWSAFLQYYLMLRAFFVDPSLLWVLFALGVGALGIAAPSSPGAIGVFEASIWLVALLAFGVDASPATAFALAVHFSAYIITGLIGGYGLYKDGESLSSLYTRLGKMKSEEQPTSQDS